MMVSQMIAMRQFLKSFKEVWKYRSRKSDSKAVVKVCPICLSTSIEIEPNFLPFIIPFKYHCQNCNYTGPIFAEVNREEYAELDFDDRNLVK
jgi:phage-related protein